jgi:hypothetical protein
MPSRADEIRARHVVIDGDLAALKAKLDEGPPEDQLEEIGLRADALTQEFDELDKELAPLAEREQKIAAVRARMAQESNREESVPASVADGAGPDLIVRTRGDPVADLDAVRTGMVTPTEVRSRAVTAIEQYAPRSDHWALDSDGAEQATRLVEKTGAPFGTAVARQMLTTGSPEYLAAFEQYLTDPGGFSTRAALSLTSANGGYLVPFTLDPTIILTNDRIEETAFAVGTGSGQPKGIIPAGTSQNRAGTAAAGPAAQDVYALQAALPARFRGPRANNVWVANLNTINALRNIPAFTGATTSIINDNGSQPTLLGKPILESTSILGAFTTGNKVLAYLDARQYYIVDRVGMSVVYDPIVLGANRRPTGQGAWYAFWRVGADVSTATAVRVFATLT